jgi:hypothetical protein
MLSAGQKSSCLSLLIPSQTAVSSTRRNSIKLTSSATNAFIMATALVVVCVFVFAVGYLFLYGCCSVARKCAEEKDCCILLRTNRTSNSKGRHRRHTISKDIIFNSYPGYIQR